MRCSWFHIVMSVVLLGTLHSCGISDTYNEMNTLPEYGWYKRDVQRFVTTVPDSLERYDLYLSMRHTGEYAYRNLWLFVSYLDEPGKMRVDTVNCELADSFGRWTGSGGGSYYQHEILLNDNYRFPGGKEVAFTVQQAMRDDRIRGIVNIGMRITPHDE